MRALTYRQISLVVILTVRQSLILYTKFASALGAWHVLPNVSRSCSLLPQSLVSYSALCFALPFSLSLYLSLKGRRAGRRSRLPLSPPSPRKEGRCRHRRAESGGGRGGEGGPSDGLKTILHVPL